ncbi:MAG: ATP-binding cassette domain-containing protein [Oscillospiraceae bacterium]|jgi:ABC-type multidrug transport system ATPase subunit|nr:ATP-binding cassette domain-containing protein [Oscillospiraceae bacterium]
MQNIIEIRNLSKQFDKLLAVNNISFAVKQGELFAFLGTNSAGKSTTISMICTLLPKTSGSIIVDGFDTDKEAAKVRNRLGVVFQNNVLDDLLTVEDNLTTRARFQGLHGDELSSRMYELRDVFELSDIWKRPFGKLSGGQKRKCEITRAILGRPEILILDEPTTGLDPQTRTTIWKLIRDMQNRQGMTVFLTTHYMEEAAAADNVIILERGKICAEGTPDALKSQYGKDTLKLRFDDLSSGMEKLKAMGYSPKLKTDYLALPVESSHEALKIVNSLNDFLDFELIKGSMDDVFLAVTGHTEVPK